MMKQFRQDADPRFQKSPSAPSGEVHISSLVVHVKPEGLARVKTRINAIPQAEVYGESPAGKLVVVLETANHREVTDIIDVIQAFEHVLTTFLVFHQVEQQGPDFEDTP
ncbi:chaperone NapD [Photobacterium sp. CCB-ST2H9]|uniref:chaperone NapD n=1 Tax=Photobacterium sp. CCB-ST2H9 TaxID=2912855 RepID=UPI002004C836|nr:chaperone NapD [Photobacterium sp. CCB-ST2H9]UTM58039.1 chaperone NapD [Photobacterium sp. CCB-ST2H9]